MNFHFVVQGDVFMMNVLILYLISGVSKVSKVFEQNEDVSVIGEVKAIDNSECIHKRLL